MRRPRRALEGSTLAGSGPVNSLERANRGRRRAAGRRWNDPTADELEPLVLLEQMPEPLACALQPLDARAPRRDLGIAREHPHQPRPISPLLRRFELGEPREVAQPAQTRQLLTVDSVDQPPKVAGATERDLHVQLVTQRRRGGRAEHPRLEVIHALLGRLVDHPRRRATIRTRRDLLGSAHQLLPAQLIECRIHARRRERARTKALL
jgi:hypothetical protein